MKEKIHEQITGELKETTRTDTLVVITAILLNLLILGINSGVAAAIRRYEWTEAEGNVYVGINTNMILIMLILIALVIVINVVVVRVLSRAKERRAKLTAGLLKMYQEEGMAQYYDPSIEKGYEARYNLFSVVVVSLGVVAILVPLVVSLTRW